MVARLLGRAPCPECGFEAAHVRQNEGKHPYRYCPECGANYATRNARQAADLMQKVRPEKGVEPVEPVKDDITAAAEAGTAAGPGAADAPPLAAPRKVGLWESLMGAK